MLSDPQSVTVNSVAKSMPRVETQGRRSVYRKDDETYELSVSHETTGSKTGPRIRSMVKLVRKDVVPDPLTSVNDYENLVVYTVIDRPVAGFSSTTVAQVIAGFQAWLDGTMVAKIYGQES
jgi:hypothetical protein